MSSLGRLYPYCLGWLCLNVGCGVSAAPAPAEIIEPNGSGGGHGTGTDGGPGTGGNSGIDLGKCGNKQLDSGELCDDGNQVSGDGCDTSCQIEPNYRCPNVGQPCVNVGVCGDGQLSSAEGCDDKNTLGGDGCAADCSAVEPGWVCHAPGRPCVPLCGDGIITPPENCDDGDTDDGDGCASVCLQEPGWSCTGTPSVCTQSQCGNGIPEADESCDKGTLNGLFSGDPSNPGCSKTCTLEPACRDATGAPGPCSIRCGDGNKDSAEQCDDGNQADGDGCSSDCKTEKGFTCADQVNPDTQPCPSNPAMRCLVLPVIYRDFDAQNLPTGHPDFFFYGAPTSSPSPGGHTTGVSPGASLTNCVPNATGTKVAWSPGQACPNSDASGPCTGIAQSLLGPNGKPVLGTSSCACVFTDWDRTGLLGTCPGSGACTEPGLAGVRDCFVQGDSAGSHRLRIDTTVKVVESAASFAQWYTDSSFSTKVIGTLELADIGNGAGPFQFSSSQPGAAAGTPGSTYYDDIHKICLIANPPRTGSLNSGFFPLEGQPGRGTVCNIWPYWLPALQTNCCASSTCPVKSQWDPQAAYDGCPQTSTGGGPVPRADGTNGQVNGKLRNFYFTTEARYLFRWDGSPGTLSFFGDDDVWVYINGHLAIDLGAPHERAQKSVTLSAAAFSIAPNNVYEIAVFHADRHPRESNYQLTLPSFTTTRSVCTPHCGDGVLTTGEECDDGAAANTGAYGGCTPACKYGPFCGDGITNGTEECDAGRNNGPVYRRDRTAGCSTACTKAHYCGDGIVDAAFGEQCDGDSNCIPTTCQLSVQ